MTLLNGMIQTGRLYEFVNVFVKMHNEQQEERTSWEFYLHRYIELSYSEWMDRLKQNSREAPTREEMIQILSDSYAILQNFNPEDEEDTLSAMG